MDQRRLGIIIFIAALHAALALPSWAQELRLTPVPPHVRPQWTPLPENAQVSYAPNLPTDVFRYRGRYYLSWGGYWYRSKSVKGPWKATAPVPAAVSAIDPAYFKSPPSSRGPSPAPGIGAAPAGPPTAPEAPGMAPPGGYPPPPPPGEAPPPPAAPPVEQPPAPKVM